LARIPFGRENEISVRYTALWKYRLALRPVTCMASVETECLVKSFSGVQCFSEPILTRYRDIFAHLSTVYYEEEGGSSGPLVRS
jgi:hypothetical protein